MNGVPILEAHQLVKRFGDFEAVKGIDVAIDRGESFGFLGPNGAGKTSTMRMISAVSQPTGGTISIFGLDPRTDGPEIRSRLGVVPQEDSLELELSVRHNLEMFGRYFDLPRRVVRERATELLEFTQLTERANDKVDNLSGGMKRRLTIARGLINRPEILILDEPTTGLDPQARHLLWDRLYRLKREGVTLIITTHYMDEAEQLCDRLVVMDQGSIVAEGAPRTLIERFSTREVVELRFMTDNHEEYFERLSPFAERVEVLPDRVSLYVNNGDETLREVHAAHIDAVERARSTQLARGRLLAPHRPIVDGVTVMHRQPAPTSAAPAGFAVGAITRSTTPRRGADRSRARVLFPILFLASLGIGVGHLVSHHTGLVDGQTYLHYIAPSLLATTTMQLGEGESLWPVLAAVKWVRTYHAAATTPLEPDDILFGKLAWVATRAFATAVFYTIIIGCFGALQSWWSLALPFIGTLVTLAFSAPLVAYAARSQSDASFITHLPLRLRADVPLLGDLLSAVGVPRLPATGGAVLPAVPRRRAGARRGLRPGFDRGPARPRRGLDGHDRRRRHLGTAHDASQVDRLMLTRTLPMIGSRRSLRVLERNAMVYRAQWVMLVSGFFEPLFYLLSISIGLNKLVGPLARARPGHQLRPVRGARECWRPRR